MQTRGAIQQTRQNSSTSKKYISEIKKKMNKKNRGSGLTGTKQFLKIWHQFGPIGLWIPDHKVLLMKNFILWNIS